MNRKDFQVVLGQVDNIGNTLLQNRMMKQRDEEREADNTRQQSQFDAQMGLRREEMESQNQFRTQQTEQNNAWKSQNEDQQNLQTIIKANADGSLDDASRDRANQWILSHPQLSATGIQLVKPIPKAPGTMETSQTRNHAELKKLQEQIRSATTPAAKAQAEQDLADFKGLLPGRAGEEQDMETVTEVYPEQKATNKPVITTTPGDKRYGLLGIDRLAKDAPEIKTTNTVATPYIPEKRVSYKRPRGAVDGGKPAASPSARGQENGAARPLDAATAKQLLQEAGGDKNKARELAKQRGYTF